ncbi:MAG: hypothetical protein CL693_14540 [Cellvibrionaceae bacterium]|nr:hypothetical protein [Cellvibrionaceae bacterium]|tara:strand:- start:1538 stop:1912 length:375 start_codon:yes stop_codon:yes gene_type:complete
MNTAKYSAEELARQAGIPVCLVRYYAQVGLLGEQDTLSTLSRGLDLVDMDAFIQCATVVGFTYEEMACLLELNDGADSRALRLATIKMGELIEQQRCITQLQMQLESWLFEHCAKSDSVNSFLK